MTINGDGEQTRDFTYVANVVDATMRAAEVAEANGRIFNVAAGSPGSVNDVADTIGRILGKFGVTWLDFPAGATREEIAKMVEAAKAKGAPYMLSATKPIVVPVNKTSPVTRSARSTSKERGRVGHLQGRSAPGHR